MNIFKKIFGFKKNVGSSSVKDFVDEENGQVTKSAVIFNRNEERLLKLENDACAIVIHGGGKVEVVFTHLNNSNDQKISPEEETIMALAMFMRQPGFNEMLRNTFHNIAMKNINKMAE